jgi:hypothetical protein
VQLKLALLTTSLCLLLGCKSGFHSALFSSDSATRVQTKADPEIRNLLGSGSVYVGLQSWFSPGVGPGSGGFAEGPWLHYSLNTQAPGQLGVDMWPDTSMYDADELFPTQLTLPNGQPMMAISSGHPKTMQGAARLHLLGGMRLHKICDNLPKRMGRPMPSCMT